jgi:prepilin-type N-terminal cleavage/methylation domain-containing protein
LKARSCPAPYTHLPFPDGRDGALRRPRPRDSGRNEWGEASVQRDSVPSPDASLGDGAGAARHPCHQEKTDACKAQQGQAHPGPASRFHSAFSLVEVMIAVVILAIAVVGLTQGFTTALASSKDSELQTTAAMFAAGQIETVRAETGLTDETTEGDCGPDLPLYRWRQTITPSDVDGLHQVSVVVENSRTGTLIYELKTLLFEVPGTESDKSKKPKSVGGAAFRSAPVPGPSNLRLVSDGGSFQRLSAGGPCCARDGRAPAPGAGTHGGDNS